MNAGGPYDVIKDFDKPNLQNSNGLYFLFWSDSKYPNGITQQYKIFPLYVGITGRTFTKRFQEHIKNENGVINDIIEGYWPWEKQQKPEKVVAYVVNLPIPVAKFFESVFLSSFDFPMNKEENNGMRGGFQKTKSKSVEDGYNHFMEKYEKVKKSLIEADNKLSPKNVKKSKEIMNNYQFQSLLSIDY